MGDHEARFSKAQGHVLAFQRRTGALISAIYRTRRPRWACIRGTQSSRNKEQYRTISLGTLRVFPPWPWERRCPQEVLLARTSMTWQDFVGAQVYVIPCGFVDFEFPVFRLYVPYRMSATLAFLMNCPIPSRAGLPSKTLQAQDGFMEEGVQLFLCAEEG